MALTSSRWHLTFVSLAFFFLPDVSRLHESRQLREAYRDTVPVATETLTTLRSNLADQYLLGEEEWGGRGWRDAGMQFDQQLNLCAFYNLNKARWRIAAAVCDGDAFLTRMSHMLSFSSCQQIVADRKSCSETKTVNSCTLWTLMSLFKTLWSLFIREHWASFIYIFI